MFPVAETSPSLRLGLAPLIEESREAHVGASLSMCFWVCSSASSYSQVHVDSFMMLLPSALACLEQAN